MVLTKETGKEAGDTGFWQWQQLGWNFYGKAIPLDKGPGLGKEVLPTHTSRVTLSLDSYLAQLMERRKNTGTSHQKPDLNLASVLNWIPPLTKSLICLILGFRILKGLHWFGWSPRILWVPAFYNCKKLSHIPCPFQHNLRILCSVWKILPFQPKHGPPGAALHVAGLMHPDSCSSDQRLKINTAPGFTSFRQSKAQKWLLTSSRLQSCKTQFRHLNNWTTTPKRPLVIYTEVIYTEIIYTEVTYTGYIYTGYIYQVWSFKCKWGKIKTSSSQLTALGNGMFWLRMTKHMLYKWSIFE